MQNVRVIDGQTDLAAQRGLTPEATTALRTLRYYYWLFIKRDTRIVTADDLTKAQSAIYGATTYARDGAVPELYIPARFVISSYFILVQVTDENEAASIEQIKEELWPGVKGLSVEWKPGLKL